jgi:putative endonuclease
MDTTAIGTTAEQIAADLLGRHGLRILERNFRCKAGELDIVAAEGDTLVFVEVRSRGDDRHGVAALAIGPAKQRQVARVAAYYIALRVPAFQYCRFDVVAITAGRAEHLRDAWRPGRRA